MNLVSKHIGTLVTDWNSSAVARMAMRIRSNRIKLKILKHCKASDLHAFAKSYTSITQHCAISSATVT